MFNKSKSNQQGFTVTEVLIVMGIFAVISGAVLVNFRQGEKISAFLLATENIASDLKKIQIQSLSGIVPEEAVASGYGAYFSLGQADRYLLFKDNGDQLYESGQDTVIETVFLPSGLALESLTTDPLIIVFKPPKPTIYLNGEQALNSAQITLSSEPVASKQGAVNLSRITGRVTAELLDR